MAANSTPLASQFAVGVAVPRRFQQLRTISITTKPHGTKIMSARANPASKHEAIAFGSKPSIPETKRDKFVTRAFPGTIKVDIPTSGVPEYTQINCTIAPDVTATVVWMNFWEGSDHILTPDESDLIKDDSEKVPEFKYEFEKEIEYYHSADTTDAVKGSVGCVSYDIGNNLQWVVAWRNATNERNKVHTEIVSGTYANVSKIRAALYNSTHETGKVGNDKYIAEAKIDRDSPKPKVIATLSLKPANIEDTIINE